MAIHEVGASGLEYLALATELLQDRRLANRGARRLKVGNATDVARALYAGAGFRVTSTTTSYKSVPDVTRTRG